MSEQQARNALVQRTKAILLKPREEWPVIDAETTSIADVYKSHVIPLAAIGPVATFINAMVFGTSFLGITHRPSFFSALTSAVVSYIFTLIAVFLMALVIDFLAPRFDGTANRTKAFKLAAYSATAAWVAAIFQLIPGLGMLAILGLYGLYLLYLGIPVMMKAPEDKATIYTVVIVVVGAVAGMIFSMLLAPLMLMSSSVPSFSDNDSLSGSLSGEMSVPGVGSIDLGKLEEAGKKMAAVNEKAKSGKATAIAPKRLAAMLPESLPGGLARSNLKSSGSSVGGMGTSKASARYGEGNDSVELTITDLGAVGGLASLGSAFNVESESQDGSVTERTGKIDGRLTTIRFDSDRQDGRYSVIVGERFNVEVDGKAGSIEALRSLVNTVDIRKLEAMSQSE
ncbi:Yip1 family protein [Parasphingorhabdus sp. JC815]|uniref:Yip1 family protein n=1 Tax=Parasphingorhabdus sp. JC815 TaxID=3232140 RepID=UPI003459803E